MSGLTREYEALLLVDPSANEETLSKAEKQFTEAAGRAGGSVQAVNRLGKRPLAYKIGKASEAQMIQVLLELAPDQVAGLRRTVVASGALLRLGLGLAGKVSAETSTGVNDGESE